MSNRNKKEVQKFYDSALGWSFELLNNIKKRLDLSDVIQQHKANVIDDILFMKTIKY